MAARLVVAGATGRIGGILGQVWGTKRPVGLGPVFTGRRAEGPVEAAMVACRMTDPEGFARVLEGADLVLDLAGPTRAPGAEAHDDHWKLFDALAAVAPCPIVTMSSSAVYDGGADRAETESVSPQSAYGRAKAEVETRVRARPGTTALRLGNVAGADALLGGRVPGRRIELHRFPDGRTPVRSYLGPVTLARVLADLCRLSLAGRLPPVLNLCGPAPVEMAALLDAAGLDWEPVSAPPGALAELTLSPTYLRTYVDLPDTAGRAEEIVAEWRDLRR